MGFFDKFFKRESKERKYKDLKFIFSDTVSEKDISHNINLKGSKFYKFKIRDDNKADGGILGDNFNIYFRARYKNIKEGCEPVFELIDSIDPNYPLESRNAIGYNFIYKHDTDTFYNDPVIGVNIIRLLSNSTVNIDFVYKEQTIRNGEIKDIKNIIGFSALDLIHISEKFKTIEGYITYGDATITPLFNNSISEIINNRFNIFYEEK